MGCWGMEDTGNETDLSGEGGTLVETSGTIPRSTTKIEGHYSRDIKLDDSEYFTHADGLSTDINGADQTISFGVWVKVESTTGVHNLISKYRANTTLRQYKLWIDDNADAEKVFCALSSIGSDATAAATADNTIEDGGEYDIWCVYDDTDIRIYINGVLSSNGASNPKAYTSGIHDSTTPFILGAEGDITNYIGGYVDAKTDKSGVFDRALSAAEILEIHNYGLQGRRRILSSN